MRQIARFGWRPSAFDPRDHRLTVSQPVQQPADWTKFLSEAWDQLTKGTCAPHSSLAAWCCQRARQGKPFFMPSRMFTYWCAGEAEGTAGQDVGRTNRDCLYAMVVDGVLPESDWPYNDFCLKAKPGDDLYAKADQNEVLEYQRVDMDLGVDWDLLIQGLRLAPVIFGFSVPESFMSDAVARTGVMPMPKDGESIIAGHSMLFVKEEDDRLLARNSWGKAWGIKGHVWMPREFIESGALADLWILTRTT